MSQEIKKIFVHGFPSLYGGAGTELHHQIHIWLSLSLEVHLIPTQSGFENEPLYLELVSQGVFIHAPNDFTCLSQGDPILGFCNGDFLHNLPEIRQYTSRTIFVNCMTWLFDKEKERMKEGLISMFLYQNEAVRQKNMPELQSLNDDSSIKFMTFKPYFNNAAFPFISEHSQDYFGCGRISRQDADKFSADTLHIYEYFVSPQWKKGLFLGFDARSEAKIGRPYDWIQVAQDQNQLSQQDFYRHCRIILQPSDTTENWPRIGFEAMSSGSVLIVNNRGGWQQMVEHGKTGWLCDTPRDFIYYASKMAYEPNLRDDMASAARERGADLASKVASSESWKEVLEQIAQLPE
ncbi:MAG: glycosyltransferase [Akkermansia sp.]